MSMTLILWKGPVVEDPEAAESLLAPYYQRQDESAFEPGGELALVRAQLLGLFPFDPNADESSPWADLPGESDRLLLLSLRQGAETPLPAHIVALARKDGLVLYDPQGPDLCLPSDPIEDLVSIPKPTAFEWFKGFAVAAALTGLTYAAWLIPHPWLRWPAVIVAGFFAAAAIFVVGAMIAGVTGLVKLDARDTSS